MTEDDKRAIKVLLTLAAPTYKRLRGKAREEAAHAINYLLQRTA